MALDQIALRMIEQRIIGADVLSLGYPDLPAGADGLDALVKMGARGVDVVDVIQHRGVEKLLDLNQPQEWPRRYGLVINPGTLEHCFNLGQAWKNAWDAVMPRGALLMIAPATMLNHGFWNFCPTAVYTWCEINGGEVTEMRFAINGTQREVGAHRISSSASGRGALPEETVMYALMVKQHERDHRWPAQGIYR
jgi:hypothetical protein